MAAKPTKPEGGEKTQVGPSELVPVAQRLRPGTRLAGYAIEGVAGSGGMGTVYRARHLHLERTVALKVLAAELASSPDFRERFLRESRTAASIHHPNIVTIHDAGEADGLLYIAMQYIGGTDLGELIHQEGALAPPRAVSFLGQVASALDAAHAHGVVHRDVKPANVLVQSDHCYLTDFGLTKPLSAQTALTARGEFVGTVHYMAPEQIEGAAVDGRTDVYALGCLAYHVLSGRLPFERDSDVAVIHAHLKDHPPTLTAARPDLPTGFDAVLTTALAKRREDRPGSCGELVAGLQAELEGVTHQPSDRDDTTVIKLLVAAEEPRSRALVRASVKGGNVQVLEAGDDRSALAIARKERPQLALIDCDAGEDFAVGVYSALRADPETADVKIVTLGSRPQTARAAALSGADGSIPKPFSPLQLLYKVRDLMGL
jgi:serine/threonine protein kinase